MHVTILQLTEEKDSWSNFDADEVFSCNESKFDRVEEHTEGDRDDDVETLLHYLGDAVTTGVDDGVRWIKVDRNKAVDLFRKPFDRFLTVLQTLHHNDLHDFATGEHGITNKLYRLNEAYQFDDVYVIGGSDAAARPISEWLRCIIRCNDAQLQYYVRAAYDGHQ